MRVSFRVRSTPSRVRALVRAQLNGVRSNVPAMLAFDVEIDIDLDLPATLLEFAQPHQPMPLPFAGAQ